MILAKKNNRCEQRMWADLSLGSAAWHSGAWLNASGLRVDLYDSQSWSFGSKQTWVSEVSHETSDKTPCFSCIFGNCKCIVTKSFFKPKCFLLPTPSLALRVGVATWLILAGDLVTKLGSSWTLVWTSDLLIKGMTFIWPEVSFVVRSAAASFRANLSVLAKTQIWSLTQFYSLGSVIKSVLTANAKFYVSSFWQCAWRVSVSFLCRSESHAPAGLFKSYRFITAMSTRLKVPAKNSPALLFLSRGKEEVRKTTTISCFSPHGSTETQKCSRCIKPTWLGRPFSLRHNLGG